MDGNLRTAWSSYVYPKGPYIAAQSGIIYGSVFFNKNRPFEAKNAPLRCKDLRIQNELGKSPHATNCNTYVSQLIN